MVEIKRKRGRPRKIDILKNNNKPLRGRPKKDKPVVKKMGQPKKDFDKQKEEILNRIAKGEPLSSIIDDENMPSNGLFYGHLLKNNDYLERYREAKIIQAHSYADKSITTILTTHKRVKAKKAQKNEVQSAKNLADEYKWQAAKLAPKVYGKLIDDDNTDKGSVTDININITKPEDIRVKAEKK